MNVIDKAKMAIFVHPHFSENPLRILHTNEVDRTIHVIDEDSLDESTLHEDDITDAAFYKLEKF